MTKRNHDRRPRPRKALILAAGFGTRMHPLTQVVPKPLLPLWGEPLVQHCCTMLKRWGVREVLVNGHHGADQLFDYFRTAGNTGLRVNLSYEADILGTGGALQKGSWFLDGDPFWVLNADVAADLDPAPLLDALLRRKTLAALWMHGTRGPRTVELERGKVKDFRSRRAGTRGTFTFCGLQLLTRGILEYLPPSGFSSIVEGYERAMKDGWRIAGVDVPDAYWCDVGEPDRYLAAHREVLAGRRQDKPGARLMSPAALSRMEELPARGVTVSGFASVGAGLAVPRGSVVQDSVILTGGKVSGKTHLADAIVAAAVPAGGRRSGLIVPAESALETAEQAALQALGVPLEQSAVSFFSRSGSMRTFLRLLTSGRRRVPCMVMRYRPERKENLLFAGHAEFLKKIGIRVPDILHDDPANCFTILEDLGDYSLEDKLPGWPASRVSRVYRQVLDQVIVLHGEGTREARRQPIELMPGFGPKVYAYERNLFVEAFLLGPAGSSKKAVGVILKELELVERVLTRSPQVLIHRDLQSSNLIMTPQGPGLIDFQGMRMGPAAYDLASLLFDPYVQLAPPLQARLAVYYADRGSGDATADLLVAGVQRLCQALGAFGRLVSLPGGQAFQCRIAPALTMLQRVLGQVEQPLPGLEAEVHRIIGKGIPAAP